MCDSTDAVPYNSEPSHDSETQTAPPADVDEEDFPPQILDVKVVVVGDGAVGKTSLCNVFVNREFPLDYEPTVFENHSKDIVMEGERVNLQLWDTAGQEGYDRIRILGYENTKCFVACFSVADAVSFSNITTVWLQELRSNVPEAKILLVGTKADLRGKMVTPGQPHEEEVPLRKIKKLMKDQRLHGYVETSAMRGGEDVDRVFLEAVRLVLGKSEQGNEQEKEKKRIFDCAIV